MIEELENLVQMQRDLDKERKDLENAVVEAVNILAPLREQMKQVISHMKVFHQKESAYVEASQKTYLMIATNMQSIGKEIEQTQGLLDSGMELVNSATSISMMTSKPTDRASRQIAQEEHRKLPETERPYEATDIKPEETTAPEEKVADTEPDADTQTETDEQVPYGSAIHDTEYESIDSITQEQEYPSKARAEPATEEKPMVENVRSKNEDNGFWNALRETEAVVDEDESMALISVKLDGKTALQHKELKRDMDEQEHIEFLIEYDKHTKTSNGLSVQVYDVNNCPFQLNTEIVFSKLEQKRITDILASKI
jgi:hypothetical protein